MALGIVAFPGIGAGDVYLEQVGWDEIRPALLGCGHGSVRQSETEAVMSKKIILSLVCCLLVVPAMADFITIVNPSFELPGTGKPSFPIPGWNATCTNL